MTRQFWLGLLLGACGLVLIAAALLTPAYLRAVDAKVIARAGAGSPTLAEEGFNLLSQERIGPAYLLLQVAQAEDAPNRDKLGVAVGNFAIKNQDLLVWGGSDPYLERLFEKDAAVVQAGARPIIDVLLRRETREKLLQFLQSSRRPTVQEIINTRTLTNTVEFPPAMSAAGQPFDAAVALAAMLIHGDRLTTPMREELTAAAAQANRGGSTDVFEQRLLDLLSLGQRLNWIQVVSLLRDVRDTATLRQLAHWARTAEDRIPVLFSAVSLSGEPSAVTAYLQRFSKSGLQDLGYSLRFGAGAVKELIHGHRRIHYPSFRNTVVQYDPFGSFFDFMVNRFWSMPWLALVLKWTLFMAGGFCIAAAIHFLVRGEAFVEELLHVRGFATIRGLLFALGFLLVILLLSEPFLAQESQKLNIPFRLRLPGLSNAVQAGAARANTQFMNQLSLLTLLLFFCLQALLYVTCLIKLAEIRRQNVPARMKLRLLENEEHLFDGGLYLGFVGTIIALILFFTGVIKPSLMAAYSSTSFGIIFVSILKICHVRPLRRKLILESEGIPS